MRMNTAEVCCCRPAACKQVLLSQCARSLPAIHVKAVLILRSRPNCLQISYYIHFFLTSMVVLLGGGVQTQTPTQRLRRHIQHLSALCLEEDTPSYVDPTCRRRRRTRAVHWLVIRFGLWRSASVPSVIK